MEEQMKTNLNYSVRELTYMALFTALIIAGAWITIPIGPIPFTMQTFSIFLTLLLLGGKKGTLSIIVYTLIGAIGVPVFSGLKGGLSTLFGLTGGFIIGFILLGLVYWIITNTFKEKEWIKIVALVVGVIVCYAVGVIWFTYLYSKDIGNISVSGSLAKCVIPFIVPDIMKLIFAFVLYKTLKPLLKIEK